MNKYFTSESVAAGHPDKICDQISDAIVDEALKSDPASRVAVETLVTNNQIVIAGEVTCPKKLDYTRIARDVISSLGYTKTMYHFSHRSPVSVFIHSQSGDIAKGVDTGGAGDQGMMFGFATVETPELMPLPIMLAHKLVERLDEVREKNILNYLHPDGKSEVNVCYSNGRAIGITHIILAVPHDPKVSPSQVKKHLIHKVIIPVLAGYGFELPKIANIIINGTGKWDIGGPASDTGVTGRKIIVDTYGAAARVGGGAFSGKDPTKVDRSGAYACRYLAKNLVAHGLALKAEVRIAYVIGKPEPIEKSIETFGTARVSDKKLGDFTWKLIDLSVSGIIRELGLKKPIYRKTARYGHFGNPSYPWEKVVN